MFFRQQNTYHILHFSIWTWNFNSRIIQNTANDVAIRPHTNLPILQIRNHTIIFTRRIPGLEFNQKQKSTTSWTGKIQDVVERNKEEGRRINIWTGSHCICFRTLLSNSFVWLHYSEFCCFCEWTNCAYPHTKLAMFYKSILFPH